MSRTLYRLVWFVGWRATKWYLREKLPSRRRIVASIVLAFAAAAAAGSLLRRLSG
jgi:hypothetical protein